MNDFDFLKPFVRPSMIILTTAKADYTIRAFEHDIVQYLSRPFTIYYFMTAIDSAGLRYATSQISNT